MKKIETSLKGVFVIVPNIHKDKRGFFFETFRENWFKDNICSSTKFVQENQSFSHSGVLRGLHFQKSPYQQAKLVRVLQGKVQDIIVDLRKNSPSYGKHIEVILSSENQKMVFIPKGFAHGFLGLSDENIIHYKCDEYYNIQEQSGIYYADPQLNINWKIKREKLLVSDKDSLLQKISEFEYF